MPSGYNNGIKILSTKNKNCIINLLLAAYRIFDRCFNLNITFSFQVTLTTSLPSTVSLRVVFVNTRQPPFLAISVTVSTDVLNSVTSFRPRAEA